MNDSSPPVRSAAPARESTEVTCSSCSKQTTVPFTPTPGRPVYCRECFAKRGPAPMGRGGPGGPRGRGGFGRFQEVGARPRPPRKRMLAQGRKAHFVYDALETLDRGGTMPEEQRRMFVEMLFTRGSRQSTDAAREFVSEKETEGTVTENESKRLRRLLDEYSFFR